MEIKLIELRDRGTFIPIMAIKLGSEIEKERWLLSRAGYGVTASEQSEYVLFARLGGGLISYNPSSWPAPVRTYREAHRWLIEHWDEMPSGGVLDVQYILGETDRPKESERMSDTAC